MALVLFIRKFPKLGIYVVMFTSILYTFLKFFIIYVLFLIAFALSFYTLLHDPQVRINLLYYKSLRLKNVIAFSFSCVCPVTDHEFRHNIVKVAVDPRGDSPASGSADYFDNIMTSSLSITGQMHEKLTSSCLLQ